MRGKLFDALNVEINFVLFEGGTERRRDGAGETITIVTLREKVEKGESLVSADCRLLLGVDEVPGASDFSVGDVDVSVKVV